MSKYPILALLSSRANSSRFSLEKVNSKSPHPILLAKSFPVPIGNTLNMTFSYSVLAFKDSSITHSTVPSPPQIIMYTEFEISHFFLAYSNAWLLSFSS